MLLSLISVHDYITLSSVLIHYCIAKQHSPPPPQPPQKKKKIAPKKTKPLEKESPIHTPGEATLMTSSLPRHSAVVEVCGRISAGRRHRQALSSYSSSSSLPQFQIQTFRKTWWRLRCLPGRACNRAEEHAMHVTGVATHTLKPVLNWANVCSRTKLEVFGKPSWFLIGRPFLHEASWEFCQRYTRGPKSFTEHVLGTFALFDEHCLWLAESRAPLWMKKK